MTGDQRLVGLKQGSLGVFDANTIFFGEVSTQIIKFLVVTSLFAVLLSFHNALSRYMFFWGREKFLSQAFSKAHLEDKSPHVASIVLTLGVASLLCGAALLGLDPVVNLYMWMVGLGTLVVLVVQAMGAFAMAGFFRKNRHLRSARIAVFTSLWLP